MVKEKKNLPTCFGHLEIVFPKGNDELRHTPVSCLECTHKTECLRSAMGDANGLNAQEEFVDRAYSSGMIGFLERWSKKKDLRRRIKTKARHGKTQNPTDKK